MTAVHLNAELYKAMGEIAEDEVLLKKVLRYVKKLAANRNDQSLMTKEDFFAKLDKGEEEFRQGKFFEMEPANNKKHRLVYRIFEDKVLILLLSSYGHYDDK